MKAMKTAYEILIPETDEAIMQIMDATGYSHCAQDQFEGASGTGRLMRKAYVLADSLPAAQKAVAATGCVYEVWNYEAPSPRSVWTRKAREARRDGRFTALAHYASLLIRSGVSSQTAWRG